MKDKEVEMPAVTDDHKKFRNQAAHAFLNSADIADVPDHELMGNRDALIVEFKNRNLNLIELKKMAHQSSKKYGKVPRILLTEDRWEFTRDGADDWRLDFIRARRERSLIP